MATANERTTQATDYVVLQQRNLKDEAGEFIEAWVEAGPATSTTRTGAVTDVAGEAEGIWRPVPTRNWRKPIRTRTQTETKTITEEVEDPPF